MKHEVCKKCKIYFYYANDLEKSNQYPNCPPCNECELNEYNCPSKYEYDAFGKIYGVD